MTTNCTKISPIAGRHRLSGMKAIHLTKSEIRDLVEVLHAAGQIGGPQTVSRAYTLYMKIVRQTGLASCEAIEQSPMVARLLDQLVDVDEQIRNLRNTITDMSEVRAMQRALLAERKP